MVSSDATDYGYLARIVDVDDNTSLYTCGIKRTEPQARMYTEGMLDMFAWLYNRRASAEREAQEDGKGQTACLD
jgi:hypothetical protein